LREIFADAEFLAPSVGYDLGNPSTRQVLNRSDLEPFRRRLDRAQERTQLGPRPQAERWAIRERYEGIELAQLVVINVRQGSEIFSAFTDEIRRIRRDPEVFKDVLGFRGKRTPVMIVQADLMDAKDPGTRKAIARVRRQIRRSREH
jgi:hypothetical protein